MGVAVPFPGELPAGFEWFAGEEAFDADRHLALEEPDSVVSLADLGYEPHEIEPTATTVAASSPFRILSVEGAEVMLATARRLRVHTMRAGNRIEQVVRSGCYRSRWLRDLCLSPDVTDLLSRIYGVEVAPHTMPVHLGHLNYEPTEVSEARSRPAAGPGGGTGVSRPRLGHCSARQHGRASWSAAHDAGGADHDGQCLHVARSDSGRPEPFS